VAEEEEAKQKLQRRFGKLLQVIDGGVKVE
jgi:hypothetical protein